MMLCYQKLRPCFQGAQREQRGGGLEDPGDPERIYIYIYVHIYIYIYNYT